MGLALRNPSEPTSLTEHRYLPGRPGTEGQNPHAKHHRRPLSWSTAKLDAAHLDALEALEQGHGPLQGSLPRDFPRHRQHLVKLAQANHRLHREYSRHWQDRNRRTRTHLPKAYRQGYAESVNGGRALARSAAFLPNIDGSQAPRQDVRGRSRSTSRSRSNSPPSLGRQDAFRDPLTTKKRSYRAMALVSAEEAEVEELYRLGLLYDSPRHRNDVNNRHDDEQQERELYQMGLLYDDEHERGAGFTFDAITRDKPIYKVSIDTRRTKRGRRTGRKLQSTNVEGKSAGLEQLPLDLSYAVLGDDSELAALLRSAPISADILLANDFGTSASASPRPIGDEEGANAPLTVVYELEDDDYSQEDTLDGENRVEFLDNSNNLGSTPLRKTQNDKEEDENETWAFINNNDDDDYDNGSDADGILMTADEQEAWIHIEHHPPDLGISQMPQDHYDWQLGEYRNDTQNQTMVCSGRKS
ncbi:hypothetical protein V8F20_005094 [Naviculisporaceae sp. PSN 640]